MEQLPRFNRHQMILAGVGSLLAIAVIDYLTPWELGFANFYLIPVILVGFAESLSWGIVTALSAGVLSLLSEYFTGHPYSHPAFRWWDAFHHFLPLVLGIAIIHILKKTLAREQEAKAQLATSLSELRDLREILPICAWCGKTRDDQGYWERLDRYLARTTRTKMTHGICPECFAKFHHERETTETAETIEAAETTEG